jgi:two-component system chemotaxis response regulator CheY
LLNNSPAGDVPDLVIEQARAVIADDSLTLRRLLRVILEDCGVAVVAEARDGRQAIDMVREHKPDLLCLDVEMPVMDGIAALAHIRAIAPELPVMMITGRADRETVQGAAKMGARGYIVKPYHRDKVNAAVRHLLKLG